MTRHWVVTPVGTVPLQGTRWGFRDLTHTQRVMPGWAVVLAVGLFFFVCFFSLLFLAIRIDRVTGIVEVQVDSPSGFTYATQLSVSRAQHVSHWRRAVAQAQALALAST